MATLFHIASYGLWTYSIADTALTLSALLLVVRPSSLFRLSLLALLQIVALLEVMPRAANHWLFTGFINGTFLIALLRGKLQGKDREQIFAEFFPAARLELVILWVMAAFHKLNYDYFAPTNSCAVLHYRRLLHWAPILADSEIGQHVAIYFSILIEAAIPVLLLFRKTRIAAIFLGCVFHFLLALSPFRNYYNFSSMLFALYFLFAPQNFSELLASWAERNSILRKFRPHVVFPGLLLSAILLSIAVATIPGLAVFKSPLLYYGPEVAWFVYGLLTILLFYFALRRGVVMNPPSSEFLRTTPIMLIPVFLVLLNGLSPYLGIKTETSFSMFSNLQTEQGKSNHFLIHKPLRLTGYADDVAIIVQSSDRMLQMFANEGLGITFFELRDYVSNHPDIALTYIRGGIRKDLARAADDVELSKPIPMPVRKILRFQPVQLGVSQGCRH